MSDVLRLLADATPLPWKVGKSVHHDGHNLYAADTQGDITSPDAHIERRDADLIVQAVNNLPAHLEAVAALSDLAEMAHEHWPYSPEVVAAIAALRRVRGDEPDHERSAGAAPLDVQALNYARETFRLIGWLDPSAHPQPSEEMQRLAREGYARLTEGTDR